MMIENATIDKAIGHFLEKFERVQEKRGLGARRRRIGSELKFPLVDMNGESVDAGQTSKLWNFLAKKGWTPQEDPHTGEIIGVERKGDMNEDLASCETGFSKVEFSLAHTDNLFALKDTVEELKQDIQEFSTEHGVAFLGLGLHPVTPPGEHLLMKKKSRNLFWDRLFGGNDHISPDEGTDVHLFTINASNQVHIDVTMEEAAEAVNVFTGLAGAQVAMTANSNIWKGDVDGGHKCLAEMFWDWWLKNRHSNRYGVPETRFKDLSEYFVHVLEFPPVYVRREGVPVGLPYCPSFSAFYACSVGGKDCGRSTRPCGLSADGAPVDVSFEEADLDTHFTFFWHSARLSRYYTLENRINDQQPPSDVLAVPALTLGIMENLDEAASLIGDYSWDFLKETRQEAAKAGLKAEVDGVPVRELSGQAVEIAEKGLKERGLGEEAFLDPLKERVEEGVCPADRAAETFEQDGIRGIIEQARI